MPGRVKQTPTPQVQASRLVLKALKRSQKKLAAQSKMSCGTPCKELHARHKTGRAHETNSPTRDANSHALADSSLVMQDETHSRHKHPPARE